MSSPHRTAKPSRGCLPLAHPRALPAVSFSDRRSPSAMCEFPFECLRCLGNGERQIHHTKGLAHCRCRRRNSKSVTRIVMIPLSAAALAYARQPGFSALVFSDVKPPTGQSAAYKQSAADDLEQMGLTVLTENIFFWQAHWPGCSSTWNGSRGFTAGQQARLSDYFAVGGDASPTPGSWFYVKMLSVTAGDWLSQHRRQELYWSGNGSATGQNSGPPCVVSSPRGEVALPCQRARQTAQCQAERRSLLRPPSRAQRRRGLLLAWDRRSELHT